MSKHISQEEISRIASLARLALTSEESLKMEVDLGRIIEYIDTLNEVDTSNVEPLATVTTAANIMREDIPRASLSREDALKNAPVVVEEFIAVPKVIGE